MSSRLDTRSGSRRNFKKGARNGEGGRQGPPSEVLEFSNALEALVLAIAATVADSMGPPVTPFHAAQVSISMRLAASARTTSCSSARTAAMRTC